MTTGQPITEIAQRESELAGGEAGSATPNPLLFGNDIDSIDVATRVAMVRSLNLALYNFLFFSFLSRLQIFISTYLIAM